VYFSQKNMKNKRIRMRREEGEMRHHPSSLIDGTKNSK